MTIFKNSVVHTGGNRFLLQSSPILNKILYYCKKKTYLIKCAYWLVIIILWSYGDFHMIFLFDFGLSDWTVCLALFDWYKILERQKTSNEIVLYFHFRFLFQNIYFVRLVRQRRPEGGDLSRMENQLARFFDPLYNSLCPKPMSHGTEFSNFFPCVIFS